MSEWVIITARFPSICHICGERIDSKSSILYNKQIGIKHYPQCKIETKDEKIIKYKKSSKSSIVKNLQKVKRRLQNSNFIIWSDGMVKCKLCNSTMDIPSAINHICNKRKIKVGKKRQLEEFVEGLN